MTIGERIRIAREEAGLTQEALGSHLDVSTRSLIRYEQDESRPKAPTIRQIASVTGVKLDWLRDGTGSMKSAVKYGGGPIAGRVMEYQDESTPGPGRPGSTGDDVLVFVVRDPSGADLWGYRASGGIVQLGEVPHGILTPFASRPPNSEPGREAA